MIDRADTSVAGGVGESIPRIEGAQKVKGEFIYASDLWCEDMLWGATLRSPHPHARIRRIDTGKALALSGVHCVLTADDVPGRKKCGVEVTDQPVLADGRVIYAGQPVALVAAETARLARDAARRIAVEYEPIPAIIDMQQALDPTAPRLHESGNVLRHIRIVHGDPHVCADVWVEGEYETAMQDQAALGLEAGLAVPSDGGGVELRVATQGLHDDRAQIAPCLGLPEEKVRVRLAGVGGAFGSREDVHVQIHVCMLALHTGRPVKMCYDRRESFRGHPHRHPSRIWMRTGATRIGKLLNVHARIILDGGALASTSRGVLRNATTLAVGPYEVPNALIEGTVVYTNNPPCGAMRGFGAPQACFAYESQMDKLAAQLGIDPVDLRLRNALTTGATMPTGQRLMGSVPVREVIEQCQAAPVPRPDSFVAPFDAGRLVFDSLDVGRPTRWRRGVGFAVGFKNVTHSEGLDDTHQVRVVLTAEAGLPVAEVFSAAAECGEGLETTLAQVARSQLGLQRTTFRPADTSSIGSAGSTSASRQTFMGAGAVQLACTAAKEELARRVADRLGSGCTVTLNDGKVRRHGTPVAEVADFLDQPISVTRTFHHRPTTAMGENGQGEVHVMLAFSAQRAVVDVDEELGLVRVVQIASVLDSGRTLNPVAVEGQSEGGVAHGLGLALMEELRLENGVVVNPSFCDYLVPTTLDMPPVVTGMVEVPEPNVTYGAKGVGEQSTIASTAAIVAAIRDAVGRELNRVPVRPEDIVGPGRPCDSRRGSSRTEGS